MTVYGNDFSEGFKVFMKSWVELYKNAPIYFLMASISTIVYFLKLLCFSFFGASKDFDFDQDHDFGSEASFKLLTIQTLLIFLMSMGWLGLALSNELSLSREFIAFVAISFGIGMMIFVAFIAKGLVQLNQVSSMDRSALIGERGRTYLIVPPQGSGEGRVEVISAGGKKILPAMNAGLESIPSFVEVEIIGIEKNCLIVKKIL